MRKNATTSTPVQWLFRCSNGRWSWRACRSDGAILAACDESFDSLSDAIFNAEENGFSRGRQPEMKRI